MSRAIEFDLQVNTNKSSVKKAVKELDGLHKAGRIDTDQFQTAAASVKVLNSQLKVTGNEIADARAKLKGLEGKELDKQQSRVAKLEQSYIKLNQQISNVPGRLSDYGDERTSAVRRVEQLGDVDTSIMTGAGLLSGLGLSGAGQSLTLVSDVVAVSEQLPLFTKGIKGVGDSLRASGGVIGKAANFGAGLAAVLPGVSAGFGAVLTVLGPVVAIAAGAAIALNAFSSAQEKIKERAEEFVSVVEARAATLADVTIALQEGDQAGAVQQYQDLLKERERLAIQEAEINKEIANATRVRQREQTGGRGSVGNLINDAFGSTDAEARLDKLKESGDGFAQSAREMDASIAAAAEQLEKAGVNVDALGAFTENTAEKEAELASQREQSQRVIDQLADQEKQAAETRARAQANLAQQRATRDERELEDFRANQQKHFDRLETLRSESAATVQKIEKEARASRLKLEQKASADVLKINAQTAENIAKVQASANEDRRKAAVQFYNDQRRAQNEYQRTVFESIQDNNILQARRQQAENRRRAAEAREEFSAEQAARQAETAKRIAEIRNEGIQRQAAVQQNLQNELAAARTATAERIKQEKAALDERVRNEAKAQKELEKERQKRLERQAEDDRARDEREQKAYEAQIEAIERKKQAEIAAINAAAQAQAQATNQVIQTVSTGAKQATQELGGAFTNVFKQVVSVVSQLRGGRGSSAGARGFATGGIVPAGVGGIGVFEQNRNFAEAVIPLNNQTLDRLAASMGGRGGPSYVINWQAPVDAASREEIRVAFGQLTRAFNQGLGNSIQGG